MNNAAGVGTSSKLTQHSTLDMKPFSRLRKLLPDALEVLDKLKQVRGDRGGGTGEGQKIVCVLKQSKRPICSYCPVFSAFYQMKLFLLFACCSQPLLEAERIDMVDVREHVDKVQGCVFVCVCVCVSVFASVFMCVMCVARVRREVKRFDLMGVDLMAVCSLQRK